MILNFYIQYNDDIPINYKLEFPHLKYNFNWINNEKNYYTLTMLSMKDIYEYNLLNFDRFKYFFNYPIKYNLIYKNNLGYYYNLDCDIKELQQLNINNNYNKFFVDSRFITEDIKILKTIKNNNTFMFKNFTVLNIVI